MTIKQFVEKAIEGGWMKGTQLQSISQHDGNYMPWVVFFYDSEGDKWHRDLAAILLDPEAWKAVGKVEGNVLGKEHTYTRQVHGGHPERGTVTPTRRFLKQKFPWRKNMRGMTSALVAGKTIEQYLETL